MVFFSPAKELVPHAIRYQEHYMRFGDLTYEEIRGRAAEGCIAIVPTGCTEQQGPHLPVDFDTWFAQRLMEAAAEEAERAHGIHALVLPAIPFGPAVEHRSFGSGYIDIPVELHQQVLDAVLTSLADQGFSRILVWQGCGGHRLTPVVERFNASGRARVFLPRQPFHAIWCDLGLAAVPDAHAGGFATSICIYLRPQDVRMDRILDPHSTPVDWQRPDLDFSQYSWTGAIGNPTIASAELGKRLWEESVKAAADEIRVIAFNRGS